MVAASPVPPRRLRRQAGAGAGLSPTLRLAASGAFAVLCVLLLVCHLFLYVSGVPSPSTDEPTGLAQHMADPTCAGYADTIQDAAQRGGQALDLSHAQMLWVAALAQGQAALRARSARLLVFGYSWHSDVLAAANCGGHTVFLESSLEQIDRVRGAHPFLEVHIVHYRGKHEEENAFFSSPWLIDVPAEVRNVDCYDVILVDTPASQDPIGVNRMESSYFAIQNARRCITQGKVGDVVLLLHDSQRPLEQRIIKELWRNPDPSGATSVRYLGTVRDAQLGDLAAFRVMPRTSLFSSSDLRRSRRLATARRSSRRMGQ